MEEIFDKVVEFLGRYEDKDLSGVNNETQLVANLGFNSLELIEIVDDVEENFNITVEDEDLDNLVTVGDLVNLIAKYA